MASICTAKGWHYIIGFDGDEEDITNLERALASSEKPKLNKRGTIPSGKKKRRKK